MRDFIRNIVPKGLLEKYRRYKKKKVRKELEALKKSGQILSKNELVQQLKNMGIVEGDILMVHSSMSKIGYLENGPATLVDALLEVLGSNGHLCMPSSPVAALQFEHIQKEKTFDVRNTPSAMGAVTEYFRKLQGVKRSAHPTEPVAVWGKDADWFVKDHLGQPTPYNLNSPWHRIMERKGKILYIGVTLINSGTHLHVLEDLTDFKYPVYASDTFEVTVIDNEGKSHLMRTAVHNPEFSKRRKCDELIPRFISDGVLKETQLGKAKSLLLDANMMLQTMVNAYHNEGITMYTPNGEKIEGYE